MNRLYQIQSYILHRAQAANRTRRYSLNQVTSPNVTKPTAIRLRILIVLCHNFFSFKVCFTVQGPIRLLIIYDVLGICTYMLCKHSSYSHRSLQLFAFCQHAASCNRGRKSRDLLIQLSMQVSDNINVWHTLYRRRCWTSMEINDFYMLKLL